MLEKCTKTSSPCSREMKPNPFSALKNFTVPCATNTQSSRRQTNQFGLLAITDCTRHGRRHPRLTSVTSSRPFFAPRPTIFERFGTRASPTRLAGHRLDLSAIPFGPHGPNSEVPDESRVHNPPTFEHSRMPRHHSRLN